MSNGIELFEYSSDTCAIIGEGGEHTDAFTQMGGKFNNQLLINKIKTPGWIFSKSAEQILKQYIDKVYFSSTKVEFGYPESHIGYPIPDLVNLPNDVIVIKRSVYDKIVTRIAELEKKLDSTKEHVSTRRSKTDMYDIGEVDELHRRTSFGYSYNVI